MMCPSVDDAIVLAHPYLMFSDIMLCDAPALLPADIC